MQNYQAVFKRKEIKYLLSREKRNALLPILEACMEPDAFAHSSISNLYYDTPDFRMVRRSLEKPMYKEKLRLRSYGMPENTSTVFSGNQKESNGNCLQAKDQPPLSGSRLLPVRAADCFHRYVRRNDAADCFH